MSAPSQTAGHARAAHAHGIPLIVDAAWHLQAIEGVPVLDGPGLDPTKLVVLLAGLGANG